MADTVIKLKDGTVLRLKGELSADEVSDRVAAFQAERGQAQELIDPRMAALMIQARQGLPQPMFTREREAAQIINPQAKAFAQAGFGPQNIEENVRINAAKAGNLFAGIPGMVGHGLLEGKLPGQTLGEELVIRPGVEQVKKGITLAKQGRFSEAGGQTVAALPGGQMLAGLAEQAGTGDIGGALAGGATQYLVGKAIADITPSVGKFIQRRAQGVSTAIETLKNTPKELRSAIHDDAINVRDHVSSLSEVVKGEASDQMRGVSAAVDTAIPEGIAAKPVRVTIRKDLSEIIKTKEALPPSLQEILTTKTKQTKTTGPAVSGRVMDLSDPNQLIAFDKMKAQGVFSTEEIARIEGGLPKTTWSFEELKQLRTKLGNDIWGRRHGMSNTVRSAATKAYDTISQVLNETAEKAGRGAQWKAANAAWSQYMTDFWKSPVRNIAKGENATQIYKPLSGQAAEQVSRILDKYKDKGYQAPQVEQAVTRFQKAADAVRQGKPTRYDAAILAATGLSVVLGPHVPLVGLAYEAGRFGVPFARQRSLTKQARRAEPLKRLERVPQ